MRGLDTHMRGLREQRGFRRLDGLAPRLLVLAVLLLLPSTCAPLHVGTPAVAESDQGTAAETGPPTTERLSASASLEESAPQPAPRAEAIPAPVDTTALIPPAGLPRPQSRYVEDPTSDIVLEAGTTEPLEAVADAVEEAGAPAPAAQPPPASPAPAPSPAQAPAAEKQPAGPAEPTRVVIGNIGVSNPLVPVGLHPDRTLVVPDEAKVGGWYTGAPRPGNTGPAVLVGHNAWRGETGIFYRLHQLVAGDVVEVHHDDGSVVAFRVYQVEQYPKDDFPTQRVYGNTDGPELRVITCGGVFDRSQRRHLDNIVVYAQRI